MEKSFYARYHVTILAVVLFLLPLAIVGAINAKNSNKNQVKDWLPADLQPTTATIGRSANASRVTSSFWQVGKAARSTSASPNRGKATISACG